MSNKEKTPFEIFGQMTADNNQKFKMANTVVGARKTKQGYVIEMGVDEATGSQIAFDLATGMNTNMIMLFVVDREEYLKYKDRETQNV